MEQESKGRCGLVTVQFHPQETFIQSWDVNDRRLLETKSLKKIDDLEDDWSLLKDAIDSLDPKPSHNITVMLITDEWSNTKTPSQVEDVTKRLEQRIKHPVEVVDADEMAAVATWETIGSELPEKDQFKWIKRSRVVCLGIYNDHTGIALVEAGRIIKDLSLPQDSFPWQNIMLKNIERNGSGFHLYLIRKAINDYVKPMYSPDVTVVYLDDPNLELDYTKEDPTVRVIGDGKDLDRRKDAGYGALLHWIKEQIGWRAFFIDDALHDDEESQNLVSLTIGGDEEDDPDLMEQIHGMMESIGDDNDNGEFLMNDEDNISIPTPSGNDRREDRKTSDDETTAGSDDTATEPNSKVPANEVDSASKESHPIEPEVATKGSRTVYPMNPFDGLAKRSHQDDDKAPEDEGKTSDEAAETKSPDLEVVTDMVDGDAKDLDAAKINEKLIAAVASSEDDDNQSEDAEAR